MSPEALLEFISTAGPGKSAEDLARDLGHPLHQERQRGMCDCIPSIHKHLQVLLKKRLVYRIGQYFWLPTNG